MGIYGDTYNAAVAAELRAQRARVKMTISDLVDRTGLAKSTVLNYLNGNRDIPLPAFVEICKALDTDGESILRAAEQTIE